MKTYVITGSTSGIGKALLEEYSKNNIVFAGYRNENLKIEGENIIPFYIDLTKPETITNAVSFILSKTEKVDTLINSAGCVVAGAIEYISMDEIRRQFEVNVFGGLDLAKQINPDKILNLSSMSSFGIYPFIAPYCASKRALDIFFNLYQLEKYNSGIKIISLKLGSVATPIWSKSIKENSKSIENAKGYERECTYLVKNAQKNERYAKPISSIVKTIIEIDNKPNPKPSYTIGIDAKLTEIISHLPQGLINWLVLKKLSKK